MRRKLQRRFEVACVDDDDDDDVLDFISFCAHLSWKGESGAQPRGSRRAGIYALAR